MPFCKVFASLCFCCPVLLSTIWKPMESYNEHGQTWSKKKIEGPIRGIRFAFTFLVHNSIFLLAAVFFSIFFFTSSNSRGVPEACDPMWMHPCEVVLLCRLFPVTRVRRCTSEKRGLYPLSEFSLVCCMALCVFASPTLLTRHIEKKSCA